MQAELSSYCEFRNVSTLVLTWNAGASKPTHLANDPPSATFFPELLASHEPPDMVVFGFQELVDLEDKKTTACECWTLVSCLRLSYS